MFLIVLIVILITAYMYLTKNYDYWLKRNVKHEPPIPIFGNHFINAFGVKSIIEVATELYNKYPNEKVVGYYRGRTPELIVRDLDIAKAILSTDFPYFYPRGLGRDPKLEPVLGNLFHADGDLWKLLRQRFTPAFTRAKLRGMFPLVVRCAEKLQDVAEKVSEQGGECDVRELMARFTTEFIGACGFGLEFDTINDENSQFRKLGKTLFTPTWRHSLLVGLYHILPEFRNVLHHISDHQVYNDLSAIVKGIRQQRNGKPSGRNDFIDLLLELESKGTIKSESIENYNPDGTPVTVELEMDHNCMVAQVFIFFAAGFETSSSATSYTLHELAYHPEIQRKIQEEIDKVLLKYDNKLCHDAVAEMSLLSMAFKEAMRLFPSLGNLHRICARRYTIPELNITIDPGVKIIIPIQAIQNDEKYFHNATEFYPERFAEEKSDINHKFCYLPFGAGPRACVGERLGEMQSLAGLAALLHKFNFEPSEKTLRVPEVEHRSNVVQAVKGGLPLRLVRRKTST